MMPFNFLCNIDISSHKKSRLNYKDFCNEEGIFDGGDHASKCNLCDKIFVTAGILEIHLQKIHNEVPLISCEECKPARPFMNRTNLSNHFRKCHATLRWNGLVCEICDAFGVINGFSSLEKLGQHFTKAHGQVNLRFSFLFLGKVKVSKFTKNIKYAKHLGATFLFTLLL